MQPRIARTEASPTLPRARRAPTAWGIRPAAHGGSWTTAARVALGLCLAGLAVLATAARAPALGPAPLRASEFQEPATGGVPPEAPTPVEQGAAGQDPVPPTPPADGPAPAPPASPVQQPVQQPAQPAAQPPGPAQGAVPQSGGTVAPPDAGKPVEPSTQKPDEGAPGAQGPVPQGPGSPGAGSGTPDLPSPESTPAAAPAANPAGAAAAAAPPPGNVAASAAVALDMPRDLNAVAAGVERLISERTPFARRLDLGTLPGGRRVPAMLFGAEGPLPLEERPVVLMLGSLDGESPAGGLAVLHVAGELLREPAGLSNGVAFAAVPWASPEAQELSLQGRSADGRNLLPVDEDRDRRVDEDGPDDLDGDGMIVQMLVEDPEGLWVRAPGQRLLSRAKAGDAPRYSLCLEGKDDDGDGRFNEDGPGGVVLDLNFPVGREGPWKDNLAGLSPLSDPLARNYADFALVRHAAVVILFQGSHGRLAIPGGSKATAAAGWMPEADRGVYEKLLTSFQTATGRRTGALSTLYESRGRERRGAALDWFYSVAGALAVEVAPWGPALDAPAESAPENARFDSTRGDEKKKPLEGVAAEDQAWIRWLDDTSGGIGFIDWHPVDVGLGRQVLVGGWEPGARSAPPPQHVARALQGLAEFTRRVSASLPRLEVRLSEVSRDGEVCKIRARVANVGQLPTGLSVSDARVDSVGAWLMLELPTGAKLIAGSERCRLSRLAGGGSSRECEWIVVAPAGSSFALRAGGDWALSVSKEVTP